MPRFDRRSIVHAYLLDRLREECRARGRAAAIAQATGFTAAHISRVLRGKAELGDLFAAALLALWKLDRHTIEQGRVVSGRERERVLPPNLQAAVEFVVLPGWGSAL